MDAAHLNKNLDKQKTTQNSAMWTTWATNVPWLPTNVALPCNVENKMDDKHIPGYPPMLLYLETWKTKWTTNIPWLPTNVALPWSKPFSQPQEQVVPKENVAPVYAPPPPTPSVSIHLLM
ncbi:Hypothetical predicted protein [Mytilus galloprovincialis]|uniref:Uncharacterized protein n=1 Tax=Mytilus galloprovincialis TaxID=29158 RepID=A0A8B6HCQ6_MYTGA|nr:Hypothetical predicted protein [Mytilus galloprovincialis]